MFRGSRPGSQRHFGAHAVVAGGSRALDGPSTSARRAPARYRRVVSGSQGAALEGEAPLANLRSSARGWHGIQLAVLGFIGLCGVIQGNGKENPDWVSETAAVLVVGSLVLSCLAVGVVGTVAWPVDGSRGGDEGSLLVQGSRRLRGGIALTFLRCRRVGGRRHVRLVAG